MDLELEKVKDLIATLEKSKLKKLSLKKGDFELILEKEEGELKVEKNYPIQSKKIEGNELVELVHAQVHMEEKKEEGKVVTSPMVGTFYAGPGTDQPPFVKIGDKVSSNTVVCIIEAMKVMNEVKAGHSGTIKEIFVDNGKPVEFGTKLFSIL